MRALTPARRAQDAGFADAFGAWKFVGTRVDALKPISLAARTAFAPAPAASPVQLAAAATRVQPAAAATPVQRAAAATPVQPAAGASPVQLVQVSYYADTTPAQPAALATPPARPLAADAVPAVPAALATPPTQLAADAAPAQPAAAATPPPARLAADAAPAQPAAGAPDRSGAAMDYFQDGQPQALGVALDGNGSFAWQALDAARPPSPPPPPIAPIVPARAEKERVAPASVPAGRPSVPPPRACTACRARPARIPCARWARAAVSGPAPCRPCTQACRMAGRGSMRHGRRQRRPPRRRRLPLPRRGACRPGAHAAAGAARTRATPRRLTRAGGAQVPGRTYRMRVAATPSAGSAAAGVTWFDALGHPMAKHALQLAAPAAALLAAAAGVADAPAPQNGPAGMAVVAPGGAVAAAVWVGKWDGNGTLAVRRRARGGAVGGRAPSPRVRCSPQRRGLCLSPPAARSGEAPAPRPAPGAGD